MTAELGFCVCLCVLGGSQIRYPDRSVRLVVEAPGKSSLMSSTHR